MKTHDVTHELESVISQLIDEGKEPTVALVKARLSHQIPMPAIIATIRNWKSSKRVPKIEVEMAPSDSLNAEQRIEVLEKHVAQLMNRVAQLEQQAEK